MMGTTRRRIVRIGMIVLKDLESQEVREEEPRVEVARRQRGRVTTRDIAIHPLGEELVVVVTPLKEVTAAETVDRQASDNTENVQPKLTRSRCEIDKFKWMTPYIRALLVSGCLLSPLTRLDPALIQGGSPRRPECIGNLSLHP